MEIIAIRLPILILGLNGVPGFALFRHFNKLYGSVTVRENVPGVIGIRPIKHPCVFGENVFGVDAEETERLGELFEKFRFGTVIDASGNCALKACECDPARSRLLNYSQGVDAATFAARYNATLIRISADMVLSGNEKTKPNRPYVETDPKDPIHNYGKHQAEAEDAITAIKPDVVILRVPLPMDYAPGGCAGAIDWITYRFRPGRPATLFTDEYRNPLSGPDLCRTVQYILEHKFPAGIYNCGGTECRELKAVRCLHAWEISASIQKSSTNCCRQDSLSLGPLSTGSCPTASTGIKLLDAILKTNVKWAATKQSPTYLSTGSKSNNSKLNTAQKIILKRSNGHHPAFSKSS